MEIAGLIKRILVVAAVILICFILQTGLFSQLKLAGVVPNLMVVVTSTYSFLKGKEKGMLVGFFSGICLDLFSGGLFGMFALIFTLLGYLNGFFRTVFFGEDIRLPLLLIGISDIVYGLMMYLVMFMMTGSKAFLFYFTRVILPEMVYTVLISIFLYYLILKVDQLANTKDDRRNHHIA